jgi:hypothetical protein
MPFGKHKGVELPDLPEDYLLWLAALPDLRPPLRIAVDAELRRRETASASTPRRERLDVEATEAAARIVTQGYRLAAMDAHPDRGGDTATMQAVNRAAAVLRRYLERVGAGPAKGAA